VTIIAANPRLLLSFALYRMIAPQLAWPLQQPALPNGLLFSRRGLIGA
jgi:hypothetical protein